MQRLIDANELWGQIYKLSYKHRWKDRTNIAFSKCLDAIQFFPTVDAEPVVRCKDCAYPERSQPGMVYCPNIVGGWVDDNGYCSYGEKKKEAEWDEPDINPCRGCDDYDGEGGCLSNGGCGAKMDEVIDE